MSARETSGAPLRLAVIGHTNTGKTSLMRTLLRDVEFGEVADAPGTTRVVSGAAITVDGSPLIELYDTPGLEDPIGLLDLLESMAKGLRRDGVELVERFLEHPDAAGRFAPEARAIRQLLASDAALYVIDARDRVLEKHRDELRILGYCARPVIPVLNFVAGAHARSRDWREQLARVNMHAVAEFDTVVLESDGEIHLFEKVQTLLDGRRDVIERVIAQRRGERAALIRASAAMLADLLVDVAAYSVAVDARDEEAMQSAMDSLRERVRERERKFIRALLELHRFRPTDCVASSLPVEGEEWATDLFSARALQEYGIRGGGGAATGAMVGLTIDILSHGLSLGTGTALGAAIGAALGAGRMPGARALERLRGRARLRAESTTWHVLATRQIDLIHALLHRGHAGREPVKVGESGEQAKRLDADLHRALGPLRRVPARPEWSTMADQDGAAGRRGGAPLADLGRRRAVERIAESIERIIRHVDRRR